MKRHIVVVDVETNGLDPERHQAVEVAWWNLTTDERGVFVPEHTPSRVLERADIAALRVNRYVDRLADAPQDVSWAAAKALWHVLDGQTLAGSNPAFDALMLQKLFASVDGRRGERVVPASRPLSDRPASWHHRLWDLSAYAAGVLALDELPGLARVCELLSVDPPDHTAEGDVTATGRCLQALQDTSSKLVLQ